MIGLLTQVSGVIDLLLFQPLSECKNVIGITERGKSFRHLKWHVSLEEKRCVMAQMMEHQHLQIFPHLSLNHFAEQRWSPSGFLRGETEAKMRERKRDWSGWRVVSAMLGQKQLPGMKRAADFGS